MHNAPYLVESGKETLSGGAEHAVIFLLSSSSFYQ